MPDIITRQDFPRALGSTEALLTMIEITLKLPSDDPARDLRQIADFVAQARDASGADSETIAEIIEGCRLGGISLEQRLAVVEFSTIPRSQHEARLITAELDRRRAATGNRCGQAQCLPARQFNREVEIHNARPKRPHLYHIREYALHCDMEALRVHARCWDRITEVLFGGDR